MCSSDLDSFNDSNWKSAHKRVAAIKEATVATAAAPQAARMFVHCSLFCSEQASKSFPSSTSGSCCS